MILDKPWLLKYPALTKRRPMCSLFVEGGAGSVQKGRSTSHVQQLLVRTYGGVRYAMLPSMINVIGASQLSQQQLQ